MENTETVFAFAFTTQTTTSSESKGSAARCSPLPLRSDRKTWEWLYEPLNDTQVSYMQDSFWPQNVFFHTLPAQSIGDLLVGAIIIITHCFANFLSLPRYFCLSKSIFCEALCAIDHAQVDAFGFASARLWRDRSESEHTCRYLLSIGNQNEKSLLVTCICLVDNDQSFVLMNWEIRDEWRLLCVSSEWPSSESSFLILSSSLLFTLCRQTNNTRRKCALLFLLRRHDNLDEIK